MREQENARRILSDLPAAGLDYQEWLHIGMALKAAGVPFAEWDSWSALDRDRYNAGQTRAKWESFRGNGIGFGTLVEIARQRGVKVKATPDAGGAFGWDDRVSIGKAKAAAESVKETVEALVDERWVEAEEVPEPDTGWSPGDMVRYLESMFEPDEHVGIVASAWFQEDSGRWLPQKGVCDRTRQELVDIIRQNGLVEAIGETNPAVGAWVRINPLDGQGVKDTNVTAYRHTLIEADDQDLGKQLALIRAMRLPCSAVVHSGGKSIHALVRVDARDNAEYRERVDRLYEVCKASGLKVDNANRNPSRLSRLPGIERAGRPQYLIDVRCGCSSWEDWERHIEEQHDDLPDPEQLSSVYYDLPPLATPLIEGVLRCGHKMRLTGPSKAGKSFGLIEMAIAMAEGRQWLGMNCKQCPVMYVNLELDRASSLHRFRAVYEALGWSPDTLSAIEVWNLRGHSVPLEKLAPKLIHRARGRGFGAIIVDPIYKLNWGDENDAGSVARFCNHLDAICTELGVAVIDSHHHSKGNQGQKRSIDRGSGSGVFGRDPDAILDLIELDISKDRRQQLIDRTVSASLDRFAFAAGLTDCDDEAKAGADAHVLALQAANPSRQVDIAEAAYSARLEATRASGWRVEATLREFAAPEPRRVWFRYPIHSLDRWELLEDAKAAGEEPPWEAERREKAAQRNQERERKEEAVETAIEAAGGPGTATIRQVSESLGMTEQWLRKQVKKMGLDYKHGVIVEEVEE